MNFGYTILYVADVAATVAFYGRAFGFKARFVHEGGDYAELETGATVLAFASRELARSNGVKFQAKVPEGLSPAMEVGFVTDDVAGAFARAVEAGATAVVQPKQKPWGQTVGYVRDLNGFLVELCTPVVPVG